MVKPAPVVVWQTCQACDPCEAPLVWNLRAVIFIDLGETIFNEPSHCNNCHSCRSACTFGMNQMAQLQDQLQKIWSIIPAFYNESFRLFGYYLNLGSKIPPPDHAN